MAGLRSSQSDGVKVFDLFVIACMSLIALVIATVLFRLLSVRLREARQERLKAHLDWVNPIPQTSRKRSLVRR